MKKVNRFSVVPDRSHAKLEKREFSSWHKIWQTAIDASLKREPTLLVVYDSLHPRSCVAVFSSQRLETEIPQAMSNIVGTNRRVRWLTQPAIDSVDDSTTGLFISMNATEFEWLWVNGASHEVPFRLNLIERQARKNPNGYCAVTLALISEWREWLIPRANQRWERT